MLTKRSTSAVISFTVLTLIAASVSAAETKPAWEILGDVVDDQGKPVNEFEAGVHWSANGRMWDDQGKFIPAKAGESPFSVWKNEGELVPFSQFAGKHVGENKFSLAPGNAPRALVFVIDKSHKNGGYAVVEHPAGEKPQSNVSIKLAPLTRVHGQIDCPDIKGIPDWTMAVIHIPGDKDNYLGFVHCGSARGKFSFLLPPGKYDLDIYSASPDARMPKPHERKQKDAPADMPAYLSGIRIDVPRAPELDLGTQHVDLPRGADGQPHSYYLFVGKEPPPLSITDARGISKEIKLSDLKGKWVLLDFWALWCGPCVYRSIPDLAKFYEDHAADRDRFEILAICNTKEEGALTLKAYDAAATTVMKDAWQGKAPPFPILIDGEGKTSEAYGITGWPTTLLIDPAGHLVKNGDEAMLAKKLKEKK